MCWTPTDLPLPDFFDPDLYAECGISEEIEDEDGFNARWDPREDFAPEKEGDDDKNDCGWIGEDDQGVWLRLNPMSALARDPLLWDLWTEWRFGVREITSADFRRKSNFEVEAWAAMRAAENRQQLRRMKERDDGDA